MQKKLRVHKKSGSTEQGVIIQNVVVRPVVRSTQDITSWRLALQSAEALNPIRVQLYDLYADLLLDGTLSSVVGKRILGVTKTQLVFLDSAGNEVPEIQQLIKKKAFRKLRKEIMLQKIWGITVTELSINEHGNLHVYSVPRKHIKPKIGRIVYEQYGEDGIDYREPPYDKYIIEVGEADDLGLLLKAAPYVIYKRGGFGDWSQFAEIFGMPFREARYDGYNDAVRKQLETAMEQAGSAAYIILPKEAEFTLHESRNTSNNGELYNTLRRACNEELCILILGQTETTTSSTSSGYAQSQTHADVEDQLNADDKEDELSYFNEQVLPVLANLGYPVTGGTFTHKLSEEKLTKKEKADIIVKLKKEANLPVGDDFLYNEFSIPKPDDYEAQKAKQEAEKPGNPPSAKKRVTNPDTNKNTFEDNEDDEEDTLSMWDRFRLKLADFFAHAPAD